MGLGVSAANPNAWSAGYGYGTPNNGNMQSQAIAAAGNTFSQSYTYDGLNRLKTARETNGWNQVLRVRHFLQPGAGSWARATIFREGLAPCPTSHSPWSSHASASLRKRNSLAFFRSPFGTIKKPASLRSDRPDRRQENGDRFPGRIRDRFRENPQDPTNPGTSGIKVLVLGDTPD